MKKYLKKVEQQDCDLLFKWANDDEVRKNAFNLGKIEYNNHLRWFNNKIKSKYVYIFILFENSLPIGQIRLELKDKNAEIDYSIDLNHRAQGNGTIILNLFEDRIRAMSLEVNKLVGKVKYSNIPSQKAFEKSNYIKKEKKNYVEYVKVINK